MVFHAVFETSIQLNEKIYKPLKKLTMKSRR